MIFQMGERKSAKWTNENQPNGRMGISPGDKNRLK
jgi:hypothetical protein